MLINNRYFVLIVFKQPSHASISRLDSIFYYSLPSLATLYLLYYITLYYSSTVSTPPLLCSTPATVLYPALLSTPALLLYSCSTPLLLLYSSNTALLLYYCSTPLLLLYSSSVLYSCSSTPLYSLLRLYCWYRRFRLIAVRYSQNTISSNL